MNDIRQEFEFDEPFTEHAITSRNVMTEKETGRVVAVFYNDYDLADVMAYQAAHKAQQAEIERLRAALKQAQIFVDGVFEQEQQPTLAAAQVGRIIAKALEGNQ